MPALDQPAIVTIVAERLHLAGDDPDVTRAVAAAVEYVTTYTNFDPGEHGTDLAVQGFVVFAERLYRDGGFGGAIGDPSFPPLFTPEDLYQHVHGYFDKFVVDNIGIA